MGILFDVSTSTTHIDNRSQPSVIALAGTSVDIELAVKRVSRYAPATCGELIQGALDEQDFLINCPIDRYARASAHTTDSTRTGWTIQNADQYTKIQHALELLGIDTTSNAFELNIVSNIPRGKGMASSSADLAAAVAAAMGITGQSLSTAELTRLFATVEPSDCVHLSGISHVDHLNGEILDRLPAPSGLGVIALDCGGEVETTGFDRDYARSVYRAQQPAVQTMVKMLKRGLWHDNLTEIAMATTISAIISQKILPKPNFSPLLKFVTSHGALGVNCAHSGTIVGVLFEIGDQNASKLQQKIADEFGSAFNVLGVHQVIGGGVS